MGAVFAQMARSPAALPPLVGAVLQVGLALFLVLKRGELRVRLAFAAIAFASTVWALAVATARSSRLPILVVVAPRVALCAITIAGPCSLMFVLAILRARHRFLKVSFSFSLMAAAGIATWSRLTTVALRGSGFYPTFCPAIVLATVAAVPPIVLGLVLLHRSWAALPPCRRRRQLGWAIAATACGLASGIDVQTVFWDAPPIAWFTGTLSCVALYYAIAAHRLMAIQTVARQTLLGLAGAAVAAACAYVLLLVAGTEAMRSPWFSAVAAGGLFAAIRIWTSMLEPQLARLLAFRRRSLERAMAEFERGSLEARTTSDVKRLFGRALQDGLDVELRALYSQPGAGPAPLPEGVDPLPEDVAPALAGLPEPVLRDLVELDTPGGRALAGALDALHADALVPLRREGIEVGLAALVGPALHRADDEMAEDLGRLSQLAARAWTNARLYEEVARRQEGLEAEVRDRTGELEHALADLKSAQVKLVEAERSSSLGLLVAGISHEINNALNFISANLPTVGRYAAAYESLLDRAERAGTPPRGRDALDVARARAELPRAITEVGGFLRRISAVVSDLRKFARPDTERRLVRVEEGLDTALNLLRRQSGRLDVVRVTVGQPQIDGYPGPLNQCFFNLLLNAVEAARETVSIFLRTEEDGGVELVIHDDGDGLPQELLEQPLQPFFTTKPARAGLGLTVSRGIVERHGGTLALERGPGGGALVRVRLPAQAPEPPRVLVSRAA